jgi:hypothetical protein
MQLLIYPARFAKSNLPAGFFIQIPSVLIKPHILVIATFITTAMAKIFVWKFVMFDNPAI